MKKEMFLRNCPKCGKELSYTNKKNRNTAIKKKRLCGSCASVERNQKYGNNKKFIETYGVKGKWIGKKNPFYGKHHSEESLAKMQKNKDFSTFKSKKFKDKMSKISSGKNNPMYGKNYYDIWVEKYGEKEANKKMAILRKEKSIQTSGKNNPMYGKPAPQGSGNGWSGWYKGWFFRSIKELSYMVNVIEVNGFQWRTGETKDLCIKYTSYDGTERTYRADFLVEEKKLVEVKPIKLFNTPKNLLKKQAAVKFCKKNGYDYEVVDVRLLDFEKMESLYNQKKIRFTKKYKKKYEQYINRRKNDGDK